MSRVIVVSETVYNELQKIKNRESFSKTIEALIKCKGKKGDIAKLEEFFGILNKKEGVSWKGEVNRSRRTFGKSRLSVVNW
ncbi:MAG: antitoxin [Candidatus Marsarchaeota archaeon]|nr:antitoxin [Candidatus Marsarchaeota archaeon]